MHWQRPQSSSCDDRTSKPVRRARAVILGHDLVAVVQELRRARRAPARLKQSPEQVVDEVRVRQISVNNSTLDGVHQRAAALLLRGQRYQMLIRVKN